VPEVQHVASNGHAGPVDVHDHALLDVEGVSFSYGRLQVLFDVSLRVHEGERVALLGTNGAGKSTLLRLVSGLALPSSGTIRFAGTDVTRSSPAERVDLGLVQLSGGKATFPTLSVRENLQIGAYPFLGDHDVVEARMAEVLELFPVLGTRLDQRAGTLSGGEQQMMALGRTIIAGPRLLIIDELSLGLAPIVMGEILATVDRLCQQGMTMLVVEQSLNVAASITDRAYFLEKGAVRFTGHTGDLLERGDLARSVFFGEKG
jgi:ABC-type branched-subunit amino acid transport system ATPase component